jgi:Sigma-54 interaction domain/FHA domain
MTISESMVTSERARPARAPGLLAVVLGGRPASVAIPLGSGRMTLGRSMVDCLLRDRRVSKIHAEIVRGPAGWSVFDLGSRNGVFIDGKLASEGNPIADGSCIRLGDSVFLWQAEGSDRGHVQVSPTGWIAGPQLQAIASCSTDRTLLIKGSRGSGREGWMRFVHEQRYGNEEPFHPINCARPQSGLAVLRVLAATSALCGTIYLDDVDALSWEDQASIAELIHSRRAPLQLIGASTTVQLAELVAAGRFHPGLYRSIAEVAVDMPDFASRRAELPWLIRASLPSRIGVSASLYYRAMVLDWPGGLRQLRSVIQKLWRFATVGASLTACELDLVVAARSAARGD